MKEDTIWRGMISMSRNMELMTVDKEEGKKKKTNT